MVIKYIVFLALISYISCTNKPGVPKYFHYCSAEQKYCIKTIVDTAQLTGRHFEHTKSYTSLREFDSIVGTEYVEYLGYVISWGNSKPGTDWGPFRNYTYDTLSVKYLLNLGPEKTPIYFMKLHYINDRKYITVCNELIGRGIIIDSYFYSDSLNILIETLYIGEFDYSKINIKRHFDLLQNTIVYMRE